MLVSRTEDMASLKDHIEYISALYVFQEQRKISESVLSKMSF